MAEDGQLARIAGRPVSAEPSLADLVDPVALEERLREARARRAEALARRPDSASPPGSTSVPAPLHAPPHDPPPAFLRQPAAALPAPRRPALALPILIFLAGLGLGGAAVAVLALQALPSRIAALPAATFPAPVVPAPAVPAPAIPAPAVLDARPPDVAASPAAPATASAAPGRESPPPTEAALTLPDPAGLSEPASEAAPPDAGAPPPVLEAALPPATETPATGTPQAGTSPAGTLPAETPSLPAQVFIHYPASAAETAVEARDALRAAGVAKVEIIPIRFAIGRSNIRYYHDGDRQPAAALAPLVAPALAGEPPEARDFTDYATPAAPGKVEVWLAGDPGPTASRAPARAAPSTPRRTASTATTFQMPGVIAPPPSQAEAVERILIERLRQGR